MLRTCTSAGPWPAAESACSGTSDESKMIWHPLYTLRLFSSRPTQVGDTITRFG